MEELLSPSKKEGGKHARTLKANAQKTVANAVGATATVFASIQAVTQKNNLF